MPYVECDWCGKECYKTPWQLKHTNHSFCSKDCQYDHQGRNHKLNTTCNWCGKRFFKRPALKKRDKLHHCSRDCYTAWQSRDKVTRICETCGKEFQVSPSFVEYHAMRFCSQECAGNAKKCVELTCEQCGKTYSVIPSQAKESRFCSARCKQLNERIPQVGKRCKLCGKTFAVWPSQIRLKFCDAVCFEIYRHQGIGGNYEEPYYGDNWHIQRNKVLRRDRTCQVCGGKHSHNGYRPSVHHIIPLCEFDGDWRSANKLSNLIALCKSCHRKVHQGVIDCPIP